VHGLALDGVGVRAGLGLSWARTGIRIRPDRDGTGILLRWVGAGTWTGTGMGTGAAPVPQWG